MKPELKYVYSTDIKDLKNFQPNEDDNFCFLLRMIVGEKGKDGEESFDMKICTPKWLINNRNQNEIIFGLHYLIVFEYDYNNIYAKLNNFINNIEENTWNEIGLKIGRIGHWEFQDYVPYKEK